MSDPDWVPSREWAKPEDSAPVGTPELRAILRAMELERIRNCGIDWSVPTPGQLNPDLPWNYREGGAIERSTGSTVVE